MREYGSEFPIIECSDFYFDIVFADYNKVYLRSGREAIHAALQNTDIKNEKIALLPAYCCHSMIAPFINEGWRVEFYRLNIGLSVDEDYMKYAISKYIPSVVLVMNYFGYTSTDNIVKYIKSINRSICCIEDFSHCIFSFEAVISSQADFYVASIRKSVGVPDGGIIVSKHKLNRLNVIAAKNVFTTLRQQAMKSIEVYRSTGDVEIKQDFRLKLIEARRELNAYTELIAMTDDSKKRLESINVGSIVQRRKNNYKHLLSLIAGCKGLRMINTEDVSEVYVPFSLPILVEDRDSVQKKFAQNGLYAPLLWPLTDKAKEVCYVSAEMEAKMLALPIDQRYVYEDIECIGRIINNICK